MIWAHITPDSQLLLSLIIHRTDASCDNEVRLHTVCIQFTNRTLRWLCFHLSKGAWNRKVGHHNKRHIVRMLQLHNTRSFNKECVLEISNRSTYFDHGNLAAIICCCLFNTAEYLITYMRDSFYTLPTILKSSLILNNCLVDHTARHVVVRAQISPEEAFIVTHVLVCLKTTGEHKSFPVFSRVHGPCINV